MGIFEFILALIFVTMLVGWANNCVKLTKQSGAFSGQAALRIVGVFVFPIGACVGYMDFDGEYK